MVCGTGGPKPLPSVRARAGVLKHPQDQFLGRMRNAADQDLPALGGTQKAHNGPLGAKAPRSHSWQGSFPLRRKGFCPGILGGRGQGFAFSHVGFPS